MPSANPIRKEILQALDHSIIPALWREGVPLGYVAAPLEFPAGITARLIDKTVPRANREDVAFPLQTCWPRANLHSSFYPYFGFLYEGVADERTLITEAQATKFKLAKGVYALRWHAPGVLLFPSGAARSGGAPIFWEGPAPAPPMKILWMSWGAELLMHTHVNRLFQRIYGVSVMYYVRSQRIAAAKNILENGIENIGEIAQLVGFKRANLFCRAFREDTGLTPGQFRRNAKRDKSTFPNYNDLI